MYLKLGGRPGVSAADSLPSVYLSVYLPEETSVGEEDHSIFNLVISCTLCSPFYTSELFVSHSNGVGLTDPFFENMPVPKKKAVGCWSDHLNTKVNYFRVRPFTKRTVSD